MTDTRARDALAAALHETTDGLSGCLFGGWDKHTDADRGVWNRRSDAILAHPYTPDQRRALAAAFLDADALAEALHEARFYCWTNRDDLCTADHGEAARQLLAALRETP